MCTVEHLKLYHSDKQGATCLEYCSRPTVRKGEPHDYVLATDVPKFA